MQILYVRSAKDVSFLGQLRPRPLKSTSSIQILLNKTVVFSNVGSNTVCTVHGKKYAPPELISIQCGIVYVLQYKKVHLHLSLKQLAFIFFLVYVLFWVSPSPTFKFDICLQSPQQKFIESHSQYIKQTVRPQYNEQSSMFLPIHTQWYT